MNRLPLHLLALSQLLTATALQAEPLGRLFHTPETRAHLDAVKAPPHDPSLRHYQGLIRRSQGPTTFWLDDQAHTGTPPALRAGDRVAPGPPGATLEQRQDLLQGGQLRIHPGARP